MSGVCANRWGGYRIGALALLGSGWAAMAHQVIWTRRLVDLLGASTQTFSIVVGTLFLGMSAGSAWAALRPTVGREGWRRMMWAEVGVGFAAWVPLMGVDWLVPFGLGSGGGWQRASVALILMGSPAFAMGMVFPAVVSAAVPVGDGQRVTRLYVWNTLGGLLGILTVVFLGLPGIGLRLTGVAAIGLNLAVAAMGRTAFRIFSEQGVEVLPAGPRAKEGVREAGPAIESGRVSRMGLVWLLAFSSGLGVVGAEVVLQMQFAQVAINSHYSSSAVLVLVLGGLGCAGWISVRRPWGSWGLIAAGVACGVEPWVFSFLRPGMSLVRYELPPWLYFTQLAGLGLATAGVVMVGAGLVFPWLLKQVQGAREWAGLLALNGLGGWVGAEWIQGWVMPRAGIWGAMSVLGGLYGMLAVWLAWLDTEVRGRRWLGGLGAMVSLIAGVSLVWVQVLPQVGVRNGDRVVSLAVGREGVVATVRGETNDWRLVMNNTYTLGGSLAQGNQERQALLPMLLHGEARTVGLLGFATGSTTAGASLGPWVEAVDAFELSPWVAVMAGTHFGAWNREVLKDPKVHLRIEDARIAMVRSHEQFDVVVGDLFLPWKTGEARMYAREHFRAVRRGLREGGVFCQWLPLFQLTRSQFEVIARTFQAEFPKGFLLRGDFYGELPIVGLCGTRDGRGLGAWDWERVDQGCRRIRELGKVRDPLMRHVEGVAMQVLGEIPDLGVGPVHTLAGGWVEWDAGRNIVGLRQPWHVGVPWAEFARAVHRDGARLLPPGLRGPHDSGQFFLTLEIAAIAKSSVLGNLTMQIPERLPSALRGDRDADWEGWPSRVKVPALALP